MVKRTLLSRNAMTRVSIPCKSLMAATYFQKVGLNTMLAAETAAVSIVAFASGVLIAIEILTPQAALAKVDVFAHDYEGVRDSRCL